MPGIFPQSVSITPIFIVAGMDALFAAPVRAPITGIILVIELTGSFGQFLPIMITCLVVTVVTQWLGGQQPGNAQHTQNAHAVRWPILARHRHIATDILCKFERCCYVR